MHTSRFFGVGMGAGMSTYESLISQHLCSAAARLSQQGSGCHFQDDAGEELNLKAGIWLSGPRLKSPLAIPRVGSIPAPTPRNPPIYNPYPGCSQFCVGSSHPGFAATSDLGRWRQQPILVAFWIRRPGGSCPQTFSRIFFSFPVLTISLIIKQWICSANRIEGCSHLEAQSGLALWNGFMGGRPNTPHSSLWRRYRLSFLSPLYCSSFF